MLRTPRQPWFSLTERPGHLRLRLRPERLGDRANPSLLVRRQQHHAVRIRALIDLVVDAVDGAGTDGAGAEGDAVGGLVLMANEDDHLRLVRVGGSNCVRLVRRRRGTEETLATAAVEPGPVVLEFSADDQDYRAGFGAPGQEVLPLSGSIDGRFLSTEMAGGFTGVMVGLYASSQGGSTAGHLDVDWFEYLASASVEGSGIEALDHLEARP
jgi:alpha-N-arabinofuranosidase